ncbi:OsmC family protein [Nocardioides massiliensis]|uniref:OsmC-like protein n=1 Tax=Nocardioides massiliensis TaxID=1325935 RepID=A0ABT9NLU6_9ACTN|nr:OsmC family protein [Nocardioides massiliensis]MDP9821393.1 putative OsmC-like protein [Nocardioides massiliensis]
MATDATTGPAGDPTPDSLRSITLTRTAQGEYRAENGRGAVLDLGTGDTERFTPVELLLVAIAGCSSVDVDFLTSRRTEPERFVATMEGHKAKDAGGNHMTGLRLTFDLAFPEGEAGDAARSVIDRAIQQSHDRLCTVSRTVELGTPIEVRVSD